MIKSRASTARATVVLVALLAPVLSAQQVVALTHGRVVDGNGGAPIVDGVVIVRGERIVAVGTAATVSVPRDARTIDVAGKTVMPGLVDSHVHLVGGWDGSTVDMLGFQRYLNALLFAGVTRVLDTGNMLFYIQQLRQEIADHRLTGPSIHMLGPLLDGAYPVWPEISYAISSTSQMARYVSRLKRAGVDGIKAYVGLSETQLGELVNAAAAESLRVFVDAGQRNGTEAVARTGIAAFAHIGTIPVTDGLIALMRERHIATISTLAVRESLSERRLADLSFLREPLLAQTMPPQFVTELARFATRPRTAAGRARADRALAGLHTAMANVKRLVDAGVLVAAGTDAAYPGDFFGEGLHRELELLVEAGLTPLQAITLATRNAATLLQQDKDWGTLEPGKRADLLVITGDPTRRIGETRNIELVMQGGQILDRAALRFDAAKDPGFRVTAPVDPPAP